MSFTIDLRFLGGLSQSQQSIFDSASSRWSEIITSDLPRVQLANGEIIDDVRIDAQAVNIDGDSGILGQAGPTQLRPDSFLPATGLMRFDSADLTRLEVENSLEDVIIHEMGHVLGFGTLWSSQFLNLITGEGSNNPVFNGINAAEAYKVLTKNNSVSSVPLANTGGQGTRDGHWRESIFIDELMTGFINPGENPISQLTIAAFEDMGYSVDYNVANAYILPELRTLKTLVEPNKNNQCCMCSSKILRCSPIVLPKTAYLD